MTDDVFRIAMVVGAGVICLSFLVQAIVAIALARRIRKLEESAAPVLEQRRTDYGKDEPMLEEPPCSWIRADLPWRKPARRRRAEGRGEPRSSGAGQREPRD